MARVVGLSGERVRVLDAGWELARMDAGEALNPEALARSEPNWRPARVPGTVAESLLEHPIQTSTKLDTDASDWWYRTRFTADPSKKCALRCDGLATLCDVWLNGRELLRSENMFVAEEREVTAWLAPENELLLRFRSLSAVLAERRGRARWRPPMVTHPELRRIRTTLFGRMPGWTPLIAPVGPWRPVSLIEHGPVIVRSASARAGLQDGHAVVRVQLELVSRTRVRQAVLSVGSTRCPLAVSDAEGQTTRVEGSAVIAGAERWWPHTHGAPRLHEVVVELDIGEQPVRIELGSAGFRSIDVVTEGGDFELRVNGERVFCRGAVFLPFDALSLDADEARLEALVLRARDAGMNMLRVPGNGTYPSARFHTLCDRLGILVWQDFMFARLDYPTDEAFVAEVRREAEGVLDRLELSPSLAVLCGNSEVEQTVAMLGLPRELAENELFRSVLPQVAARVRPDVAYVASSPSGGVLPFHPNRGVSHYFGVGAYRRPLTDARLAAPRFATECLAFSNLPDDAALARWLSGAAPGSASWKAGIPADAGASWDFEDVREHYLESCFGQDVRELRTSDRQRWITLGRLVSGEVMGRVLSEWRRRGSATRGALLYHLADGCAGAGVGLLDDLGQPKAAYWFVARALAPISVHLIDEGLNGLWAHVVNETGRAFAGELGVALYRNGRVRVGAGQTAVALPPRSSIELSVDALAGGFVDSSHAYRFGPPEHDLVAAALRDLSTGVVVSDAFHFPLGAPPPTTDDAGISATLEPSGSELTLEVRAEAFVYGVHLDAPGLQPSDDYFHLEPGRGRTIVLYPDAELPGAAALRLSAANVAGSLVVRSAPARSREARAND